MASAHVIPLTRPLTAAAAGDRPASSKSAAQAERRAQDAALVARALKGDDGAFRALVERYQRQVYWVAHDVLLDEEEARDVAQETFLRVHGALASFDTSRDLVNWLYRIARNLAIDAHRRRKRRATLSDDLTGVPERAPVSEGAPEGVAERVRAVLSELPVEYRLALTLREFHGLAPLEIARVTDCSYPTARWRLHRARHLFRQRWEALFGTQPGPGDEVA